MHIIRPTNFERMKEYFIDAAMAEYVESHAWSIDDAPNFYAQFAHLDANSVDSAVWRLIAILYFIDYQAGILFHTQRAQDDPPLTLQQIADDDLYQLQKSQTRYGESWQKRGGVGAFMALARKYDRLVNWLSDTDKTTDNLIRLCADRYTDDDGPLDDVGDLRRYLLLVAERLLPDDA